MGSIFPTLIGLFKWMHQLLLTTIFTGIKFDRAHLYTYHRVGRTARMKRKGRALIFLTPAQEKPMVQLLKTNNIDVAKLKFVFTVFPSKHCFSIYFSVDPNAITDIHNKLQSVLAQFPELNQFAQKVQFF